MIKPVHHASDADFSARVSSFFDQEGPLRRTFSANGKNYEERPQQKVMAKTIADCFVHGEHLCVEAPTGVGKSFAYLVPAIYFSKLTDQPVVISTNTIALQEQLINRDIPVVKQLLETPFTATLAKGRENYLCVARLRNATEQGQIFLPSDDLLPDIQRILEWSKHTLDGSRSDLEFIPSGKTWAVVCSEFGNCPFEMNRQSQQCFFMRARKQLCNADIIVTNHALFSVDLAMRRQTDNNQSILPDYCAVIIDEAHCFEDVSATHLGIKVTSGSVLFLLNRLYNPRTNRGLLVKLQRSEVRRAAVAAQESAQSFFAYLCTWLNKQDKNPLVYNTPGHIPNMLSESWITLEKELSAEIQHLNSDDHFALELSNILTRLSDTRQKLDKFLSMDFEDCVYWFEYQLTPSRALSFHIVPIEVSTILKDVLFNDDVCVVLTSATLSFKNDLGYIQKRIGAESSQTLILDSPYDYTDCVDLFVPFSKMPTPKDSSLYADAIAEQIKYFVIKSNGRAFVLFTSYTLMNDIAAKLREFFVMNKMMLMVQGQEYQRSQMLDRFRSDINSVIFGTDSFWMGVDVPGESLSNVIIVKLPFAVPSHPLISARFDRIQKNGGNAFWDYSLPEAVIKFRQGIGRLIRSRSDSGMIVVLDPRIIRTSYGQVFLESIPDCRRHIF